MTPLRLTSVIPTVSGGGIGPVCLYAAKEIAKQTGWTVTLLCLHDPPAETGHGGTDFRFVSLGLENNCPVRFLDWLRDHPQDIVITSDVSRIEQAFPFFPPRTLHLIQIHDGFKRYRSIASRNLDFINGITCVGHHIEKKLREDLSGKIFRGPIRTIHNGAVYPAPIPRSPNSGPLRLLYMGRLDAFKGIFDLVALLCELRAREVPVVLTIAGGENEDLRKAFERRRLQNSVRWAGLVPHEQCYALSAEADILLMTSRKEAFGMVTIEAMSMGCVPFAYDFPSGSTEIIEDNQSGLLVPLGDIPRWADLIKDLHLDRQRLGRLSAGVIARARGHFAAEVMAKKLVVFVKEVLEQSHIITLMRLPGTCPQSVDSGSGTPRGYQLVPSWLRHRIRDTVGRNAKLCHWILDRY